MGSHSDAADLPLLDVSDALWEVLRARGEHDLPVTLAANRVVFLPTPRNQLSSPILAT